MSKIVGIPACYIILSCLVLSIISHLAIIKDKNRLYFFGVFIALSIATFGSIGNVIGFLNVLKLMEEYPCVIYRF